MAELLYSPKLAELAADLAAEGKTNAEIAASLKINIKTFYKWQNQYPEFKAQIRTGKDKFDSEHVEVALLEDALGHEHDEVVLERDTESGLLVETKRTKKWERSFQAQRFWLMNRNPARWKESQEVVISDKALEEKLSLAEKRLKELRDGKTSEGRDTRRDQVA